MTDIDKAIRAAKLTAAGMLDKARAKTAVTRAGGQIAPSKYLPNIPRQVHADGGRAEAKDAFLAGNHPAVPDVVYHGTQSDIGAFRQSQTGEFGPGIYLTDLPEEAADYAGTHPFAGKGPNVMPLHLSMKNPFVVEKDPQEFWKKFGGKWDADAQKNAIAAGHDGVIFRRPYTKWDDSLNREVPTGKHHTHFVAFNPTQVKSAISARQFDTTDPDITKAAGGRIHANKGGSMGARADFLAGNHPEVPNVVYHATKSDFKAFNPMSHFGTQQAAHDRYSPDGQLNEGMSVIPAHISLKNPLDVGLERDWQSNRDTIRQAADAMFKSGRLDQDYLKAAEKLYDLVDDPRWGNYHQAMEQRGAEILREAGHDGIIYTNNIEDPGSRSFVTLHPSQVKSSIGNQGTFDPNEPDMTKADGGVVAKGGGGSMGDDDDKPVDMGVARALRRFNQDSSGPPPEVEGIFNRLAAAKDAAQEAHEAAHNAGAFENVQIGDVYKYKPLDSYAPMKVVGHGMVHVSRWGGTNPPKYVYKDHYPVAQVEYQDAAKERRNTAIELLEDRDRYDFISGKPRVARKDGGRLSLYSKAAQIIRGMKDQPMQAADIVKYALGKGAKKTEIAHVDVPPGKATPSQVAEHIEFMQPQIGVHKREMFYRYRDPEQYERQINYLERQGRHDEAEELTREFEAFEGYGGKDAPIYAKYQLPGGENYREHVLTLDNHPDDQTYTAPIHWGKLKNPLAHIRMSTRMIGNKKILHIEEMQSDWNNDARKSGFRTGREKQEYDDYVAKMREDAINGIDQNASPMIRDALRQKYSAMDPYMLALKMGRQPEHASLANSAFMGSKLPPRAPYINPEKDDVYEMAMKHVLMEAAKGGYDGIAFTPDEEQELRWPGHTFKGIYNKRLPGIAQRLVQPHDLDTDTDDMTRLNGWAVPMIPLTDKARDSITQNGFTSFRRGGSVDAALAATRRFTKDGQHVTMRLKD